MSKPLIIIMGADGQLGREFRRISSSYPIYEFRFLTRTELDLEKLDPGKKLLISLKPVFLVNCAGYTAVDKAETEVEKAFHINGKAVGEIAAICRQLNTRFIHYSTDYVFDGSSSNPYNEDATTSPVNIYGASKLKGEELCVMNNPDSIIIRTSWVYSSFGHNFVKTMIRLLSERESISVVNDQVGSPTWAADLADATMQIISNGKWIPGIFHYSNKGIISWYDFALAIKEIIQSSCEVRPIPGTDYPTPARRPSFSLLDTEKIASTFSLNIPPWRNSLSACLKEIHN
jgi:dTDP-4-dehydrorhamnose reductase